MEFPSRYEIKHFDWTHLGDDNDWYLRGKGGTRKIADAPRPPCNHPAHNPPSHQVFEPGTYEHICPACGQRTIFVVPAVYL